MESLKHESILFELCVSVHCFVIVFVAHTETHTHTAPLFLLVMLEHVVSLNHILYVDFICFQCGNYSENNDEKHQENSECQTKTQQIRHAGKCIKWQSLPNPCI